MRNGSREPMLFLKQSRPVNNVGRIRVAGSAGFAPDCSGGAGFAAAATGLAAGTAITAAQPVHFTRLPAYLEGTFSFFLQAGQETSIVSAIVEPRGRNPQAAALNAAAALCILEA